MLLPLTNPGAYAATHYLHYLVRKLGVNGGSGQIILPDVCLFKGNGGGSQFDNLSIMNSSIIL